MKKRYLLHKVILLKQQTQKHQNRDMYKCEKYHFCPAPGWPGSILIVTPPHTAFRGAKKPRYVQFDENFEVVVV